MKHAMRKPSPYWSCQAAGWSLYALGVATPYLMRGEAAGPMLLYTAALSLMGLAQTHALRHYARKHGWERFDVLRLVPRVIASSAFIGFVLIGFMVLAGFYFFHHLTWAKVETKWLLVSWLWWFFPVIVGWQAIYFGVQFVRRARRAEVEKWQLKSEVQAAELRFLRHSSTRTSSSTRSTVSVV